MQARIRRTEKRTLSNTSVWVRFASVTVRREAGKITRFEVSFSMTGVSTSAINVRLLRGANVVGDVRRITSAPGGSQDQKHFVQIDENTAGGSTTYHLEMKKGTWQGQTTTPRSGTSNSWPSR